MRINTLRLRSGYGSLSTAETTQQTTNKNVSTGLRDYRIYRIEKSKILCIFQSCNTTQRHIHRIMGNILGKDKPLKEVLRENKRLINRAIRELDREKMGLEREEKRLTMEIKKAAKENQMPAVKIMAKDLVRTRQHVAKFIEMRRYV